MKIKDLFQKDITRNINGVIKVGQDDSENIFQELDEYVITKELDKIFHKFYESYTSSLHEPTDKIGVWISGFFGSGKSHLLKILSYLLENREAKGKKALDFFKDKIADQMLYGQMKFCSQSPSDVILFNIDSKADSDSKNKKDAIVSVFLKVFNEKCGYCGELPQVAEFERMLDGEGKYEEFKKEFAHIRGESWVESRSSFFLIQDEIVDSLIKAFGMTSESAHRWLDKLDDWYKESINKFAELVSKHIKAKGKNHRVIFLVDEVGQYIADNPNLMLNLQTVIEDLGIKCGGNAWVIVTAQDDIDSLVGRIRDMDFSKIQGRFNTRLNLSSANTDEVIKKRLLTKKADAASKLTEIYKEKEPTLKSQLCFSQNTTVELKNYSSAEDFVTAYPFVPYQFTLLQKVFEAIRRTGASGKHLSQGERSMLDSFQVAACSFIEEGTDILVPFNSFYAAIEGFLDAAIKRVITQAAVNSLLENFDVEILKTLFMIKYIKEIKPNIDNITTLSCSKIDQDKLQLRKNIEAAIDRLEKQTLIQRNNDEFYFLTDEEQDVSREIKKITYDEREVTNYINDLMWNEVYPDKKYRYKNIKDYSFNRLVDEVAHGHQQNDITIKIVTPHHDEYQLFNDLKCLYETADNSTLLIKISKDSFFIDEISQMLKTEKYIKTKNSMTLPDSIKKILESKAHENTNRKARIKNMLVGLIAGANYYVCNEKFDVKLKDVKTAINNALEKLITNVYTKLSYITLFLKDEKDIKRILTAGDYIQTNLDGKEDNSLAGSEMLDFINMKAHINFKVTMKTLYEKFSQKPYGWPNVDIAGIMAILLRKGEIVLFKDSEAVSCSEKDLADKILNQNMFEKYLITVKKKSSPKDILNAQQIYRDYFKKVNVPSQEQELFELLISEFKGKHAALKEFKYESEKNKYPCSKMIAAGIELLAEAIQFKDTAELFNFITSRLDDFKDHIDDMGVIEGFFASQRRHFDDALECREIVESNIIHISDEAVLSKISELNKILNMPSPYSSIPKLSDICGLIRRHISKLISDKMEEVLQLHGKARNDFIIKWDKIGMNDVSNDAMINKYDILEHSIKAAQTMDSLIARQSDIEKLIDESKNFINDEIENIHKKRNNPPLDRNSGGAKPRVVPVPKQIVSIKAKEFNKKSFIETQQDIDEFIDELKTDIEKCVKNNKLVEIV